MIRFQAWRFQLNIWRYNYLAHHIFDVSNLKSPSPIKGGNANTIPINHAIQIHGDVQKFMLVLWMCQDRSKRTTDRYLTIAIPVIVYKELMPILFKYKVRYETLSVKSKYLNRNDLSFSECWKLWRIEL